MQVRHLKYIVVAALSALTACGGGGGDGNDTPVPQATVIGPITGFGSVIVNGVRFDDSQAVVTMNGAVQSRDRLRVGMVVQVRGQVRADGSGVANWIAYSDCVQGPITAMNRVQNTLTVLGQTVRVDEDTVFDGVTLRDMNAFAIGDVVEVSCMPVREQEQLRATRVERKGSFNNGATPIDVTGTVANLNLALGTCTVGGSSVDFSGLAAADRPQGLANGMNVEASGTRFENGVLLADRLRDRDQDRIHVPDGSLFEIEGYVADFVSVADFEIDGHMVDASHAVFRNGIAADLRNGVEVEVEGTMTGTVLVARLVVFKLQTNVRVEARMQANDTSLATLTLLGRPIQVPADTVLTDRLGSSAQPQVTTLAALNVGDRLEVKAVRGSSGSLVATYVERTDADPLVVVKGVADAKSPVNQLTLAGFTVATGASTRYRDQSGNLIDAASFYDLVQVPPAVPTMVHARGVVASLATNVVDATRSTSTTGELEIGDD
jgi:hypothetical protein